jgi:hypothetical protein
MNIINVLCKRRSFSLFQRGLLTLGLSLLGTGLSSRATWAQSSLSSLADVGVTATTGSVAALDAHSANDNSTVSASATHSFTGLDRAGQTRTMTYTGNTVATADYGSLHSYTSGSLTNSYYNATNPSYSDTNGNVINPSGSPAGLVALGFATFNDTLQYGGALQSGYKAKYIFHVDGTNSGTAALADLDVTVGSNPSETFFAGDVGPFAADWVTQEYAINGVTPQQIHIQFSDQVNLFTPDLTDGQNYAGISDFSSTLKLTGIQVVDSTGNPVSGWTVSSASGTRYPLAVSTPEPSVTALLLGLGLPASLLALRHRRR